MTDTPHIATYTGKLISCLDPQPEDIDIGDIAHALSLICRFNGHCQRFYSVAEHSVRVSVLAAEIAEADDEALVEDAALLGLMHDAHEAYPPGDLAAPVRRYLRNVSRGIRAACFIQNIFSWAIGKRFQINEDATEFVEEADKMLLAWEWRDVMGREPLDLEGHEIPAPHTTKQIQPWTSTSAELRFLLRFQQLVPGYPLADTIRRLLPLPEPAMMSKSMCTGAARDETIRLHLVLGEAERLEQLKEPAVEPLPDVREVKATEVTFDTGDGEEVSMRLPRHHSPQPTTDEVATIINAKPQPGSKKKKRKKKRRKRKKGFTADDVQAAVNQALDKVLGTAASIKKGAPGSPQNPRAVPDQVDLSPKKIDRQGFNDPTLREEAYASLPEKPTASSLGDVAVSRAPGD